MNEPLWLKRPEIRQLLDRLVDRLDRAQVSANVVQRAVKLDRRGWSAFHDAELEGEREFLWSCVEQLARDGCFTVQYGRAQAGLALYERNPRITGLDEQRLRALTGRSQRQKSAGELWREAVHARLVASDAVKEIAAAHRIELPGYSAEAIVDCLNRVVSLADSGLLLREASARLFWGHSKVLDERQALVAAMLELPECPFPESRIQLLAYLPRSNFSGVLVIENQANFERAIHDAAGRFAGLALVWSAGFRGTALRLRSPSGASVFLAQEGCVAGPGVARLRSWLADANLPTYFFGDLDFSGMAILRTLRSSFPGAEAWRPGYSVLRAELVVGGGHVASAADKAGQLDPGITGCRYADEELLPAMRESGRFVDQEHFA